jgi:LssY C-terminus
VGDLDRGAFAAGVAVVADSFRFDPDPSADQSFIARARHADAPGLKVSVAPLGPEESRRSFGAPLARYGIQPIWLAIENDMDEEFSYLPIATDPNYYSPYEVSFRTHGMFSSAANRARDAFFLGKQIGTVAPPHSKLSGFLFGQLDAGVKYAQVWLTGKSRLEKFAFVLEAPGPAFLGENARLEDLYPGKAIADLDLEALRKTLVEAPCCTTNPDATTPGDPLNLVVIESERGLLAPFVEREWHLTQKLDVASALETARAFVFEDPYETSPVSPLYLFGRREDIALQKARSTINERIHLRLWLTPEKYSGRRVWIGAVSRDIGVRLTDRTWNLTTHKIGPDVDFDRGYLLQDLLMSGLVEQFGFVAGVGAAPINAPRANLTGDPYFTDGLRLVVFLSSDAHALTQVERLPWERPAGLAAERP